MELTKLTHKLNIGGIAHVIDEPIGFDGLKTKISRGTYHGVSAEVSVSKLEFYNNGGRNAATMIRDAYNTDIDTEIAYTVTDETGEQLYSGVLDLSTYSETSGNATKISVNVGEVGIKTTFNNRTETEVDLNRSDTMDGNALAHNPEWKNLLIPAKTIVYKNKMTEPETTIHSTNVAGDTMQLPDDKQWMFLNIALDKTNLEEFGTFQPNLYCAGMDSLVLDGYVEPLFSKGEDFDKKYGATSTYDIIVNLKIRIKFKGDVFANTSSTPYFQFNAGVWKSAIYDSSIIQGTQRYVSNDGGQYSIVGSTSKRDTDDCHEWLEYDILGHIYSCSEEKLYLGIYVYNNNSGYNNPTPFDIEILQGSFVEMRLLSESTSRVFADMIMVHEALNKISEIISDNKLQVKSDWYGRFDSIVHPKSNAIYSDDSQAFLNCVGGGALKALTNGYKIRGLYSSGDIERNMPLSFKNIIESLDALDCIGWGIVEENGELCVRVERWFWFYKDDVILTINNPNEKTRAFDNERPFTEIKIGYKKYTTNEDYNSNDNFFSERTFTTSTSAISKQTQKLCAFIADNYAIEETRRAKETKDESEEFKYDENIFVFGLSGFRQASTRSMYYSIPRDISQSNMDNTIEIPSEVYNALLSPARCALRWIQRLFCINGLKAFELTSGTVNYKASFIAKHTSHSTGGLFSFMLEDSMEDIPNKQVIVHDEEWGDDAWEEYQIKEDMPVCERYYKQNIDGVDIPQDDDKIYPRIAKAETLKIKYPLSLAQYKAILANPYGLIVVDGEKCWLKEMQYEFKTGTAEFTLIPKYEQ